MITEDYVSFKTAKLLKEKGFNEKGVKVWYDESGEMYCDRREIKYQIKIENYEKFFQCPTLQMAMKWLREVHNIDIIISVSSKDESDDKMKYIYEIVSKQFIGTDNVKRTYKESCESAIKYCLEKLI